MFETEVFQNHMYCIEDSTCDIVGTFRSPPQSFCAPIVIRRPGNCAPLLPSRYAPGWAVRNWSVFVQVYF